ncbi:MAG: hypothetical protein KAR13_14220, partial [Desulfobulbaceae bacterium]|nr:hypothetical protein [Desulfobulbaceae bacterium]
ISRGGSILISVEVIVPSPSVFRYVPTSARALILKRNLSQFFKRCILSAYKEVMFNEIEAHFS